jgi:hypothetical protein
VRRYGSFACDALFRLLQSEVRRRSAIKRLLRPIVANDAVASTSINRPSNVARADCPGFGMCTLGGCRQDRMGDRHNPFDRTVDGEIVRRQARLKLGAATRLQAVARLVLTRLYKRPSFIHPMGSKCDQCATARRGDVGPLHRTRRELAGLSRSKRTNRGVLIDGYCRPALVQRAR